METFLQLVARDLYAKIGNDLSRTAIVFPNKRASLFFNEYLAAETDRPLWSPAYVSISELFRQLSPLKSGDPIRLVCELYKVFREETRSEETLDDFYFWGELLISDFDDVDKNLVDADKLFSNLQELKNIMDNYDFLDQEQEEAIRQFFQNFSIEKRTELKAKFISLWDKLGDIYRHYRRNLTELGIAYEGSTEIKDGRCEVSVGVDRSEKQLTLDVGITGHVVVECDRCLEDCRVPIDFEGQLVVKFSDEVHEYDGEVMWMLPGEDRVELAQYIYESIVLSLPYQRVHPEGECNPEMLERFRIVSDREFASIEAAAEGAGERGGGEWAKLAALRERMEAEGADGEEGEGGEEPEPTPGEAITVNELYRLAETVTGKDKLVIDAENNRTLEAVVVTDVDGGNVSANNLMVMTEGATQAKNGILLFSSGQYTNPKDPAFPFKSGDKVRFTLVKGLAKVANFSNCYEVTCESSDAATWLTAEVIGKAQLTPVPLTSIDNLIDYQGMLVTVKNVTSPATAGNWAVGTTTFKVGSSDLTVYVTQDAAGFAGKQYAASKTGDLTGYVSLYKGAVQLCPRNMTDAADRKSVV